MRATDGRAGTWLAPFVPAPLPFYPGIPFGREGSSAVLPASHVSASMSVKPLSSPLFGARRSFESSIRASQQLLGSTAAQTEYIWAGSPI